MTEYKIEAVLFFIDTVLFAVIATINIYNDNINTGLIYIGISIVFLMSGLLKLKKLKDKKK